MYGLMSQLKMTQKFKIHEVDGMCQYGKITKTLLRGKKQLAG